MYQQGFPIDAVWHPTALRIGVWWAVAALMVLCVVIGFLNAFIWKPSLRIHRFIGITLALLPFVVTWLGRTHVASGIGFAMSGELLLGLTLISIVALIVSQVRQSRIGPNPAFRETTGLAIGYVLFSNCVMLAMFSFDGHREPQNYTTCRNNLKQIGVAIQDIHETQGHWPQAASGDVPVSWRVSFLPFLDSSDHFERYDKSAAWDSEQNTPIAQSKYSPYICPARWTAPQDAKQRYFTDYVMPTGEGTLGSSVIKNLGEVERTTSNTIVVVEASGLGIVWTEPRDFDITREPIGINFIGPTLDRSPSMLSSFHQQGCNVLMADGVVQQMNEKADPTVLKQMALIRDAKP